MDDALTAFPARAEGRTRYDSTAFLHWTDDDRVIRRRRF
ncbi:hypothetical protein RKD18_007865 [Streptomyces phaeoluteigriseus]